MAGELQGRSDYREAPAGILVAERIAMARTQLEQVLQVSETNALIMDAQFGGVLGDYPEIQDYWPLFGAAAEYFKRIVREINVEWRRTIQPRDELRESDILMGSGTRQAGGDSARLLVRRLLNHEVTDDVTAEAHNYFLFFRFTEPDYRQLVADLFGDEDTENPSVGLLVLKRGVPIILMPGQGDGQLLFDTYTNHKRRVVDYIAEKSASGLVGMNILNPTIAKKLKRNNRMSSTQEQIAKFVLLGHLAIVAMEDFLEDEPASATEVELRLSSAVMDMNDPLSSDHDFFEPRLKRAPEAVEAAVNTRDLYLSANPAYIADHIASNLLAQFPLKRWGIAAQMLEKAHQTEPVPEL
jgi:hypothetical protein